MVAHCYNSSTIKKLFTFIFSCMLVNFVSAVNWEQLIHSANEQNRLPVIWLICVHIWIGICLLWNFFSLKRKWSCYQKFPELKQHISFSIYFWNFFMFFQSIVQPFLQCHTLALMPWLAVGPIFCKRIIFLVIFLFHG